MTYDEITSTPLTRFLPGTCVEDIDQRRTYRRRDDRLWKAVLEDLFDDFLRFFFPQAYKNFDLNRGFEYLDKEFDQLLSTEELDSGVRHVDKLVKVYLKNGEAKYILIHIEIQGQKSKQDFTQRMHRYWYRIKDKYQVPVTALAILTDGNKNFHPKVYTEECLGTRLKYEFNCYKVLDQDEERLRKDPNPFALIILTTLLYIKNRKGGDVRLLGIKRQLLREMIVRELDSVRRRAIFNFLNHFVHFKNQEYANIFEQDTQQLTERAITMGTEEYLLDKAMKQGLEKGLEKGRREGKGRVVSNLIRQLGLSNEQAAGVAEVSVAFVQHVRDDLEKESYT